MGNPTPAYLLKRDQEMRDIRNAIAEAATPYWKKPSFIKRMSQMAKKERLERERKESIKSVEPIVSDKSTTQPK